VNSALESAALIARILSTSSGSCAEYDRQRREDAHALW
jgi:hypothetical protein